VTGFVQARAVAETPIEAGIGGFPLFFALGTADAETGGNRDAV
jgi:hypothetical protein